MNFRVPSWRKGTRNLLIRKERQSGVLEIPEILCGWEDDEQHTRTERGKKVATQIMMSRHLFWWFLFGCLLMTGCATDRENTLPVQNSQPSIEEQWGIKLLSIRLSAEGYMLDFRYKVIEPDKAAPLQDFKFKPYLIDETSGAKLIVPSPPKVGALRQRVKTGNPIPGRTYFIIFSNTGRLVRSGRKVTVVIGDFKAEHLVVR